MAIKGITTIANREGRFSRAGKLRKGSEKRTRQGKNGEYQIFGENLEHFRFDSEDPTLTKRMREAYGEEVNRVHIFFPLAEIEADTATGQGGVWWTCREVFNSGGQVTHRCDGEWVLVERDRDGNRIEYAPGEKACTLHDHSNPRKQCKPTGRLMALIPELLTLRYVTVETHGYIDLNRITDNLLAVRDFAQNFLGRDGLQGLRCILYRAPENINYTDEQGTSRSRDEWVINIDVDMEWVANHRAEAAAGFIPTVSNRPALTGPTNGIASRRPNGHNGGGFASQRDGFNGVGYSGQEDDGEVVDADFMAATDVPATIHGDPITDPTDIAHARDVSKETRDIIGAARGYQAQSEGTAHGNTVRALRAKIASAVGEQNVNAVLTTLKGEAVVDESDLGDVLAKRLNDGFEKVKPAIEEIGGVLDAIAQ